MKIDRSQSKAAPKAATRLSHLKLGDSVVMKMKNVMSGSVLSFKLTRTEPAIISVKIFNGKRSIGEATLCDSKITVYMTYMNIEGKAEGNDSTAMSFFYMLAKEDKKNFYVSVCNDTDMIRLMYKLFPQVLIEMAGNYEKRTEEQTVQLYWDLRLNNQLQRQSIDMMVKTS